VSLANDFVVDTALPSSLNPWYQLGSILAVALLCQIVTGIGLARVYVSSVDLLSYISLPNAGETLRRNGRSHAALLVDSLSPFCQAIDAGTHVDLPSGIESRAPDLPTSLALAMESISGLP